VGAGTITAVDTAEAEPPPPPEEVVAPRPPFDARPVLVLGLMILTYVVVFGRLTWAQQSNFGTFGFDMGIYDQGIWLVSRFKDPFVTVRGFNYFGHHVNILTLVFVPFYWLGAGPHFLYLIQTLIMAAGAIPLWLLARDKTDPWTALVPAGSFLLFPSLEWINWWHFHPDALIITPLLFAWWLASRKNWKWFAVAVACALLAKEDAALAVIMLGIVLWIRGDKKWGRITLAAGFVYFLICTRLIIPIANGGKEPFYEELFPGFGHSMMEILWTMIRHPSRIYRFALLPDRLKYYRQLLYPVGLLPIGAPLVLLLGGPQTVVNVVSAHQPTHDIRYHYSSIVIAVIFIATVEVFARIVRRGEGWKVAVVALLVVSSVLSNREWSPSPIGRQYKSGIWAQPQAKHAVLHRALKLVKPGDRVTATYYIVPHLTHREYIYEFPNPFRVANWGINGEDPPSADTSDVLVLDVALNGSDSGLYDTLVGPVGQFRIVFNEDNIVVARRRGTR
jgi:uncharacterized membrane protein